MRYSVTPAGRLRLRRCVRNVGWPCQQKAWRLVSSEDRPEKKVPLGTYIYESQNDWLRARAFYGKTSVTKLVILAVAMLQEAHKDELPK